MTPTELKREAARKALDYVKTGMKVGLGTGSTAAEFVALLGARAKEGLDVACVATSEATAAQARGLGLKLATLDELPHLDLVVDGADEATPRLELIKGGGGALLREKIVAMASDTMIVIADESKLVDHLGRFPLPVEVVRFGLEATKMMIAAVAESAGCEGELRLRMKSDGQPFLTDNGNLILDCAFTRIEDPDALADALAVVPGVVEHGLFLDIADVLIIASNAGIRVLQTPSSEES